MKKIYIVIAILIGVVAVGALWFAIGSEEITAVTNFEECVATGAPIMESYPRQCRYGGKTFTEYIGNEIEKSDLIRLESPRPNEKIKSPLTIKGEARGDWFFEASFPISITDWDGRIIGEGFATAKGEWMTTDFVPFEAVLTFTVDPQAYSNRGSLILRKDNPSGLPEHDDALEVPIIFSDISSSDNALCTMDAKICPDGSAVGRVGPRCEFAPCEGNSTSESDVTLTIGAKGEAGGLAIKLNSVLDDSRCPKDVVCVWAGEAKVSVTLTTASKTETKIISTNDKPYLFDEYEVSIISVLPEPQSGREITQGAYSVTFHIQKKDAVGGSQKNSMVSGQVTVGPTCPVERIPPDPNCADKPYVTTVQVIEVGSPQSAPFATAKTNEEGKYSVSLPPGKYALQPVGGSVMPRCETKEITVLSLTPMSVNLSCDSGIR